MNAGKNMQSSKESDDQQVKCPQCINEDYVWRKEMIHLVMGYVSVFCHLNSPSPCQHNQKAFQWCKEFICYRPFIYLPLLYWSRSRGGKLWAKKSWDSASWWWSKLLCGPLSRLYTLGWISSLEDMMELNNMWSADILPIQDYYMTLGIKFLLVKCRWI